MMQNCYVEYNSKLFITTFVIDSFAFFNLQINNVKSTKVGSLSDMKTWFSATSTVLRW